MTRSLPFINIEWFWLVLIIAIIIWLIYVWKEKSKYPSGKFFVHILIAIIAITALALIALKPLKPTSEKPYKIAIVTHAFKQKQLDSLKKEYSNLVINSYVSGQQILETSGTPESVFILGHGIAPYDLWQLDPVETFYLGGNEPQGITLLSYELTNRVNNRAAFKGNYLNAADGNKLILESPSGQSIDSLILSSVKQQDFKLFADLKVKGKFLYQIIEKDSLGNIVTTSSLPITVKDLKSLNILMVNNFPTFETKYLKNYLAEKGHEVLIRSQLTKDRYKYEYFNMSRRPTIIFNQKNLKAFDLLIIDANSLNNLARRSRNAIEQSAREDGLGVYIQPDDNFFTSNNKLASFIFQKDKNNVTFLKEWPRTKINTYPYKFKSGFSLQSIQTSNSKILSAYKNLGIGRVGTSLSQNTYELQLNGNPEVYKELWTKIVENLSKKEISIADWNINSPLSFLNEPMDFNLRTRIEKPQVLTTQLVKVPLQQDIDITSLWKGRTYPKQIGWKKLEIEQDSSAFMNYYVQDSIHWKSLKAHQTIVKNKRHFNGNTNIKKGTNKSAEPINPIWFFMVFMVCVGYLWLEPKQ